ncbi:MAG: addiction module protein [Lentisphaeria bacterium]|nr:addiction module protein [Lentisphaeria bacterium]
MSISEINKMASKEKLQTMELLWDSLCHDNQEMDSPEWHGKLLAERKNKIESGTAKFLTLDELRKAHS